MKVAETGSSSGDGQVWAVRGGKEGGLGYVAAAAVQGVRSAGRLAKCFAFEV